MTVTRTLEKDEEEKKNINFSKKGREWKGGEDGKTMKDQNGDKERARQDKTQVKIYGSR